MRGRLGAAAIAALVLLPSRGRSEKITLIPLLSENVEWQQQKKKEGLLLEKRKMPGSSFNAYRLVLHVPISPDAALDVLWRGIIEHKNPLLIKRDFVRKTDTELVVYDQIKTPVVSNRDYTLRLHRTSDNERKQHLLVVEARNDLGPPPDPKFVRIPRIEGGWLIEACESPPAVAAPAPEIPCPAGGSRMTYVSYSEPGGSVPAFMVRGAQADQTLNDGLRLRDRMKQSATP